MKWVIAGVVGLLAVAALIVLIGSLLPQTHVASRTARFHATPQRIWDIVTGPPTWRPDVASFENLPPRQGRRTWREVDKHGQAITFEALEAIAPQRLVTRIDPGLPFGGTWTYEFAPAPGGSDLTITENGEVYNPLFRFVSRFIMGHTATIDAYLRALRTVVERPS